MGEITMQKRSYCCALLMAPEHLDVRIQSWGDSQDSWLKTGLGWPPEDPGLGHPVRHRRFQPFSHYLPVGHGSHKAPQRTVW
jgi:hypothetical protein